MNIVIWKWLVVMRMCVTSYNDVLKDRNITSHADDNAMKHVADKKDKTYQIAATFGTNKMEQNLETRRRPRTPWAFHDDLSAVKADTEAEKQCGLFLDRMLDTVLADQPPWLHPVLQTKHAELDTAAKSEKAMDPGRALLGDHVQNRHVVLEQHSDDQRDPREQREGMCDEGHGHERPHGSNHFDFCRPEDQ